MMILHVGGLRVCDFQATLEDERVQQQIQLMSDLGMTANEFMRLAVGG